MAAGFSPEVEEEFLSCEAEYNFTSQSVERCSEHDSSSEEEEMSVDHHMPELARLELPGPSISESSSEVDAVSRMDKLESQRVNKMVNETCGCKLGPKGTACSPQFSRDVITEQRDNCAELSKEALDMLVLGQFQAQGADTGSPDASRQIYIHNLFLQRQALRCVITVADNVHANHLLLDFPAEWLHPLRLATLGQGTCIMQVILRSAVTIHRKHCKVIGLLLHSAVTR